MAYDENMKRLLDSIEKDECAYVCVKGNCFEPFDDDCYELLARLAHHTATRIEIEDLHDMLDYILKETMPSKTEAAARQTLT